MMSVITKNFSSNIPNNYLEYYLYPDMVVEHTDKEYTRANMVMDGREKNTKEMADKIRRGIVEEVLNFNFWEHGQYIVDIAISLLNDDRRRFMLIVPNQGRFRIYGQMQLLKYRHMLVQLVWSQLH